MTVERKSPSSRSTLVYISFRLLCVSIPLFSLHRIGIDRVAIKQAGSTEPAMLVVGDLEDIFLPKPTDILVNLVEAKVAIESLLTRLSDMFKDTHNVGSALGAALQAAFKLVVSFNFPSSSCPSRGFNWPLVIVQSHVGGKIIVLSATLPNIGPGMLKNREDSKLLGTPKESTLLQAATSFYKNFAIECSRSQVSVDMWLFSSAYTDVATLSQFAPSFPFPFVKLMEVFSGGLPRYTGGQTYFYPAFNASRSEDALKFAHEFGTVVADPIALEAVMRVRASKGMLFPASPVLPDRLPLPLPSGIRMSAFHGNFFVRSTDLLSLAAVPMDQSYAIEIQIEDPIGMPFVVFQTAVLHTTCFGERRIRVLTLALPTTSSLSELYASVDTVAMATLLADKAVERSMQSKLEDARDAVTNKLVDVLHTYKTTMTSSGSGASPQLVVSDNMKFLPLLMLGLLKHVSRLRRGGFSFLLGRNFETDLAGGSFFDRLVFDKARKSLRILGLTLKLFLPLFHPNFFYLIFTPFSTLSTTCPKRYGFSRFSFVNPSSPCLSTISFLKQCGTIGDAGVILPSPLPLSSERLERHGLFLIEDGQNIFLWIGRDAVPQLVMDVFEIPSYADLRGGKVRFSRSRSTLMQ